MKHNIPSTWLFKWYKFLLHISVAVMSHATTLFIVTFSVCFIRITQLGCDNSKTDISINDNFDNQCYLNNDVTS